MFSSHSGRFILYASLQIKFEPSPCNSCLTSEGGGRRVQSPYSSMPASGAGRGRPGPDCLTSPLASALGRREHLRKQGAATVVAAGSRSRVRPATPPEPTPGEALGTHAPPHPTPPSPSLAFLTSANFATRQGDGALAPLHPFLLSLFMMSSPPSPRPSSTHKQPSPSNCHGVRLGCLSEGLGGHCHHNASVSGAGRH